MPLSEEVSRTWWTRPWSKACREKSAEVIVPKARVPMGKDRIGQCNSKWLLPWDSFVVRCPKGSLYSDDRTESDNRIEVMFVEGMAENNLPHIERWESPKPPYAERHVWWCGRSRRELIPTLLPNYTAVGSCVAILEEKPVETGFFANFFEILCEIFVSNC